MSNKVIMKAVDEARTISLSQRGLIIFEGFYNIGSSRDAYRHLNDVYEDMENRKDDIVRFLGGKV